MKVWWFNVDNKQYFKTTIIYSRELRPIKICLYGNQCNESWEEHEDHKKIYLILKYIICIKHKTVFSVDLCWLHVNTI